MTRGRGRRIGATTRRTAVCLVLVVTAGCSPKPSEVTRIVLDGQPHSFTGGVRCFVQPGGDLLILANGPQHAMVRMLLSRQHQLVVDKVGFRVDDTRGFTDVADEMWASRVDDSYTINGHLPPNPGETAAHPFTMESRCRDEVPAPPPRPDDGGMP